MCAFTGPAAYVVLTHRDPDQLRRLARALRASSPECHVFINHDDRGGPPPEITDDPRVHVRSHGRRTDWGSFEIIRATIDAFAWARDVADPGLAVLISGQDYPTRPLAAWEDTLRTTGGWIGDARPLRYRPRWGVGDEGGPDTALLWYSHRWFRLPGVLSDRIPEPVRSQWYRLLHGVFKRTEPVAAYWMLRRGAGPHLGVRRIPAPFSAARPCYKGSQWLALDRHLLDLVLARSVPGDPTFELFRHALIPDEAYLQTVLSWETPVREVPPVSYLEWRSPRDESPAVLDLGDLPAVLASGSPFCRKVDPAASASLMDALDRHNGVAADALPSQG